MKHTGPNSSPNCDLASMLYHGAISTMGSLINFLLLKRSTVSFHADERKAQSSFRTSGENFDSSSLASFGMYLNSCSSVPLNFKDFL